MNEPVGALTTADVDRMQRALDLSARDDIRLAALLVTLRAGLRTGEMTALNVEDVLEWNGQLCFSVRSVKGVRYVPVGDMAAHSVLRKYLALEYRGLHRRDVPLFWTLARHGPTKRTRITEHAIVYWVLKLRRRGRVSARVTPSSFRELL